MLKPMFLLNTLPPFNHTYTWLGRHHVPHYVLSSLNSSSVGIHAWEATQNIFVHPVMCQDLSPSPLPQTQGAYNAIGEVRDEEQGEC